MNKLAPLLSKSRHFVHFLGLCSLRGKKNAQTWPFNAYFMSWEGPGLLFIEEKCLMRCGA